MHIVIAIQNGRYMHSWGLLIQTIRKVITGGGCKQDTSTEVPLRMLPSL